VPKAAAQSRRREGAGAGRRTWRFAVAAVLVLAGWLLLSHFVVRARIESWLDRTFQGDATVGWAMLWPDLDATAYSVAVDADHHRLEASRIVVDLSLAGLLGGRHPVERVTVHGLRGGFDEGQPVELLRWGHGSSATAGADAAPDLDPARAPELTFVDPQVFLLSAESPPWRVFAAGRLDATQIGDRTYRVTAGAGELAKVPFEKLSTRLIPRAGHLLLSRLKLRAFNGMVAGMLDVDTANTGAFNGEAEWHFVEVDEVWTTYGLPFAEKRRGDASGHVIFQGDRPTFAALKGKGDLQLERASFFSPLSFRVFLVLKVPVAAEAPLTRGEMSYSFEDSRFYLEAARFEAREFELEAQGIVSFAGSADLEISHAGTVVAVSGRLEEPTITVLPFSALTAPVDRLFRERVK